MTYRFWNDEQSRPEPWPDGRRRPLAIVVSVVVGLVVYVALNHVHSNLALGGMVILISMTGFYGAVRLNAELLAQQRYVRGPGWFIALAISRLSLVLARMAYLALSTGILALGVVEIVHG